MESLIKIQQKLKAPKNADNKFGGYKYRSAEQILQAVKPFLEEEGLVLLLTDKVEQIGNRYYVSATATLMNLANTKIAETTAYAREDENLKGMTQAQITGASSSYARKYALNGLFAIDNTDDPDVINDGDVTMMTAAQKKLLDDLKIDWEKALTFLKVNSTDEVTEAQADALIKAKLKKKEGANA